MSLTHSVMGWMVLTVLSLCLPVWSAVVQVIQPYKVVSTNGTAQVQCFVQPQPNYNHIQHFSKQNPAYPYPDPEEFRVTLLKGLRGTEELCSSILNFTEQRDTGAKKEGRVQCFTRVREGALEVTVSGLKAADTDIYRCEIEIFYPPPYLRLIGNGTLLHVLESLDKCPEQEPERHTAHDSDEDEASEGMAPVGTPVVVLVVMIMVVLIVIIYFQVVQCERGNREFVRQVPGGAHKVDAVACCYENVV
ncbi:hypothetical protein Q5P01_013987 [Channa striata]|uniref:Immunoglobulin V-set domain-containing protein n=1 Tax=Channa striata TaxID=64152 RepID=A0AA88MNE7_CHASR|nr:hypothetical protein Q5P01_013987 [Channa striata]